MTNCFGRRTAEAQPPDYADPRPGTGIGGDRSDGRQTDPHHWSGACELCDDDDGRLLQTEAIGVLPRGWAGIVPA